MKVDAVLFIGSAIGSILGILLVVASENGLKGWAKRSTQVSPRSSPDEGQLLDLGHALVAGRWRSSRGRWIHAR
jgi:hypothetical protein